MLLAASLYLALGPALAQGVPVTDPFFPSQRANLVNLGVPGAWLTTTGRETIAVITDDAVVGNTDLTGAIVSRQAVGQSPRLSPSDNAGTTLFAAGFARSGDANGIAGVAPTSNVMLINVPKARPILDNRNQYRDAAQANIDTNLESAFTTLVSSSRVFISGALSPIRIVCVNFTTRTPNGYFLDPLTNAQSYPKFHAAARSWFNGGGLIFVNQGQIDPSIFEQNIDPAPRTDYLMPVATLNARRPAVLADLWHVRGPGVWFAAPGQDVFSTDNANALTIKGYDWSKMATIQVAAIASLTWSARSSLSNRAIQHVLARSSTVPASIPTMPVAGLVGFGMPNASVAVQLAQTLKVTSITPKTVAPPAGVPDNAHIAPGHVPARIGF